MHSPEPLLPGLEMLKKWVLSIAQWRTKIMEKLNPRFHACKAPYQQRRGLEPTRNAACRHLSLSAQPPHLIRKSGWKDRHRLHSKTFQTSFRGRRNHLNKRLSWSVPEESHCCSIILAVIQSTFFTTARSLQQPPLKGHRGMNAGRDGSILATFSCSVSSAWPTIHGWTMSIAAHELTSPLSVSVTWQHETTVPFCNCCLNYFPSL